VDAGGKNSKILRTDWNLPSERRGGRKKGGGCCAYNKTGFTLDCGDLFAKARERGGNFRGKERGLRGIRQCGYFGQDDE